MLWLCMLSSFCLQWGRQQVTGEAGEELCRWMRRIPTWQAARAGAESQGCWPNTGRTIQRSMAPRRHFGTPACPLGPRLPPLLAAYPPTHQMGSTAPQIRCRSSLRVPARQLPPRLFSEQLSPRGGYGGQDHHCFKWCRRWVGPKAGGQAGRQPNAKDITLLGSIPRWAICLICQRTQRPLSTHHYTATRSPGSQPQQAQSTSPYCPSSPW